MNHTILDCNKKKVYFTGDLASGKKLFFRSEPIENQPLFILGLQKGCQGFLVSVVE